MPSPFHCLWLAILGLGWITPALHGQVLIKEVISREISLHVGGVQTPEIKEVISREISLNRENGPANPYSQVISREVSLAVGSTAAPPTITDLVIQVSPTGDSATLDWSSYNQWQVADISHFAVYLSDAGGFTNVSSMTPYRIVPGESTSVTLTGLTPWTDHFFAVVAVDVLGNFIPAVTYSAAYVLSPQTISREVSIFVGAEPVPPYKQVVSREVSIVVNSTAAPPAITGLGVTLSPTGDSATLNWSSYNQWAVGDVVRFDIYLSDTGPITNVSGLTPLRSVGGEQNTVSLTGLTPWTDHFFAVVAVDGLENFLPAVNYAAGYVLSPQVISREVSLFVGAEPVPPYRQVISREISLVVPDAAVPAPVTGTGSGFLVETSTTQFGAVTLDWRSYNEAAQRDILRYRVYVSDAFFDTVTGMEPFAYLPAENQRQTLTGLAGLGIYHFAVVAEDALGGFNPAVRSFSAQASVSGVGEARNLDTESGADTLTFTWEAPQGTAGFLSGYRVYFGGSTTPVNLPANATTWTATGLERGRGYPFRITTVNLFGGESSGTSIFAATWLLNPANAALTTLGDEVLMSWDASQPSSLVRYYAIYRSGSPISNVAGMTPLFTRTGTSVVLGGFTEVTDQYFAVVAVNSQDGFDPAVQSVRATKQAQTLDFPALTVGALEIPLVATASSGLPVTFSSSSNLVAQVSGAVLRVQQGGAVTVTARQAGNESFWPVSASQTLRLPPVITSFTANGTEITPDMVLRQAATELRVVARDTSGIAQAQFFGRVPGAAEWTLLGTDSISGNGFSSLLPVETLPQGPYELRVQVSTPGGSYVSETGRNVVLDLQPVLTVALGTEVQEGGSLAGTISIQRARSTALSVTLASSQPSQLDPGPPVIIPAGQTSVSFTVRGRQDDVIEGPLSVRITASAPGALNVERTVSLVDDDWPILTLTSDRTAVPESAGADAVMARLERDVSSPLPVTVWLVNSNPAAALVPASVVIPGGSRSVDFPIGVVDNALVDGAKTASIRGEVRVSGAGTIVQTAALDLSIGDDEGPALELDFDAEYLVEGQSGIMTVRRMRGNNTPALTVTLRASLTTELQLPATVVIPAGAGEVSFNAAALTDGLTDGNKTVRITATATAYSPAQHQIIVTDHVRADLVVRAMNAPATVETEGSFSVSYQVENLGTAAAANSFVQRVFLSRDRVVGDDILLTQSTFSGGLAAGSHFQRMESLRAPREAGTYWVLVTTDAGLAVEEIIESNNSLIATEPLVVSEAYTAIVQTAAEQVPANTLITFTGSARRGEVKVPNALVSIHIRVSGTSRTVAAITNASGDFTTTWQPLPGEGGDYEIGASHPGTPTAPTQDAFTILTLTTDFPKNAITLDEASSATFNASLSNPTTHALNGIAVTAMTLPSGLTVNATLPGTTLAPGASLQAGITVTAAAGYSGNRNVTFRVTTTEGIQLDVPVQINVRPLLPRLVMSPNPLKISALRGTQKTAVVTLENQGGAASGPINVLLPNVPWMELASTVPLPSIAPGASGSFSILLKPAATDALTLHNGNLVVAPTNGPSLNLPFAIRVVSDQRGDLEIEVVDEYFYFTAEKPKVQGAKVVVRDAVTGDQVASVVSDVSGIARATALVEGWYAVEVSADKHGRWRGNMLVSGSDVIRAQVFISRDLVTYNWTVEEIEVQDRYRITVESTFETNVPAPVVTVTPSRLDVEDLNLLGQTKVVNLLIENHGFIAGKAARFNFGSHPFYEITPLIQDVGDIPAKSSIVVPVTIRRIGVFDDDGSIRTLAASKANAKHGLADVITPNSAPNVPCDIHASLRWGYLCGPTDISKSTPIAVSGVNGRCGQGWTRVRDSADNTNRTPGANSNSITFATPTVCDCQDEDACIKGKLAFEIGDLARDVLDAVKAVLPPWVDVDEESVSINAGGELCRCCDSFLGFSGGVDARAEIAFTLKVGLEGELEFDLPSSSQFSELEFDGEVLLGIEIPVSGFIGGELGFDCDGKLESCASGGVELTPFAGAQAQVEIEAKGLNGEELKGLAQLRVGMSGTLFAGITGCAEDGDYRLTACRENLLVGASLVGSLEATSGSGGGSSIAVNLQKNIFDLPERRCVGDPPTASQARVKAKQESKFKTNHVSAPQTPSSTPPYVPLNPADYRMSNSQIRTALGMDSTSGVCSRVKIKLDQEAVMTRSAFQATLELSNNSTESSLSAVGFDVAVTDSSGNEATNLFNVQLTSTEGITGTNGSASLAPETTGKLIWTLIPRDSAAPLADTIYNVGGNISYTMQGVRFVIPVSPVQITVRPDAALHLKYFHQRDVMSDDPHTDVIEPAVPYHLAVMVENKGAGAARNLTITSAQPEIVENEKGLLIDFNIIGTQVAGQARSPSLKADFGNVQPNERKVATWDITSSLLGQFIDYKATFQHLDGFGDERLSLIKDVAIHEMIQMIEAQGSLADGLPDFLVNDVPDIDDRPDTVHLSDGSTAPVTVVQAGTLSGPVNSGNLTVNLTTAQGAGWSYLRIPDPANGAFQLTAVTRSDGRQIPVGKNAWVTSRTFIALGRRPLAENILHLADQNSTGQYTLTYAAILPDTAAPTSAVAALPAQSSAFIPVRWSGQDNRGVAAFDIYASVNGGPFTLWLQRTNRISSIYFGESGNTYAFYSRATDTSGNTEPAPAAAQATTTVSLENAAPVLAQIGHLQVDERSTLTLQATATDDGPAEQLTYSIEADSNALVIDPQTGRLVWNTQETDGGRVITATVTVTDAGLPAKSDGETFTITVSETNEAPLMQPVPVVTVAAGQPIQVTPAATDADLPAQTLAFSLAGTPPDGMTIDATTGLISWTPDAEMTPQTVVVEVLVTDNGSPARNASLQMPIQVIEAEADEDSLAVLSTLEATELTSSSARTGGEVTDDRGQPVSERGIVYATTTAPTTLTGIKIPTGSGEGSFNAFLVGLTPATTYYARAYAINASGTAYGQQISFLTLADVAGEKRLVYLKAGDPAAWTVPAVPGSQAAEIAAWRAAGYVVAVADARSTPLSAAMLGRYQTIRLFTHLGAVSYPDAWGAALETWVRRGGTALIESAFSNGIGAVKRFGIARIDGQNGGADGSLWHHRGTPLRLGAVASPFAVKSLASEKMDRPVLATGHKLATAVKIGTYPAIVHGAFDLGKVVIHFMDGWSHDAPDPTSPNRAAISQENNFAYLQKLIDYAGRPTRWDAAVPALSMVAQPVSIPLGGPWSIVSVSGLPAGLRYDRTANAILGTPTASGVFRISIVVQNIGGGKVTEIITLRVQPLPASAVGTFFATMARDQSVNVGLGGTMTCTTTAAGSCSGKLRLGALSYSFKGSLISDGSPVIQFSLPITRKGLPSIILDFTLAADHTLSGTARIGGSSAALNGWRQTWGKARPVTAPRLGTINAIFPLDQAFLDDDTIPQGISYATLRVSAAGVAAWSGKMSDGSTVTFSVPFGPNGESTLWTLLYGTTGSVKASTGLDASAVLTGAADWVKLNVLRKGERLYPTGFGVDQRGPVLLSASGSRWVPPAAGNLVLGLPITVGNARLDFASAGVEAGDSSSPDLTFTIDSKNRTVLPKAGSDANKAHVSVTLNTSTGVFSGSFRLTDENPEKPGTSLTRTVNYQGLLVPHLQLGAGYFLLPQLAAPPATKGSTSPILSGSVKLD
jgi:hypothetical protein